MERNRYSKEEKETDKVGKRKKQVEYGIRKEQVQ